MQGGHEKQKIGDNRTVPVNEESSTREEPVTEQNVVVEKRMNKVRNYSLSLNLVMKKQKLN